MSAVLDFLGLGTPTAPITWGSKKEFSNQLVCIRQVNLTLLGDMVFAARFLALKDWVCVSVPPYSDFGSGKSDEAGRIGSHQWE